MPVAKMGGLEQKMEAANVPSADRDEIRRFADFLAALKAARAGKRKLGSDMIKYALGK